MTLHTRSGTVFCENGTWYERDPNNSNPPKMLQENQCITGYNTIERDQKLHLESFPCLHTQITRPSDKESIVTLVRCIIQKLGGQEIRLFEYAVSVQQKINWTPIHRTGLTQEAHTIFSGMSKIQTRPLPEARKIAILAADKARQTQLLAWATAWKDFTEVLEKTIAESGKQTSNDTTIPVPFVPKTYFYPLQVAIKDHFYNIYSENKNLLELKEAVIALISGDLTMVNNRERVYKESIIFAFSELFQAKQLAEQLMTHKETISGEEVTCATLFKLIQQTFLSYLGLSKHDLPAGYLKLSHAAQMSPAEAIAIVPKPIEPALTDTFQMNRSADIAHRWINSYNSAPSPHSIITLIKIAYELDKPENDTIYQHVYAILNARLNTTERDFNKMRDILVDCIPDEMDAESWLDISEEIPDDLSDICAALGIKKRVLADIPETLSLILNRRLPPYFDCYQDMLALFELVVFKKQDARRNFAEAIAFVCHRITPEDLYEECYACYPHDDICDGIRNAPDHMPITFYHAYTIETLITGDRDYRALAGEHLEALYAFLNKFYQRRDKVLNNIVNMIWRTLAFNQPQLSWKAFQEGLVAVYRQLGDICTNPCKKAVYLEDVAFYYLHHTFEKLNINHFIFALKRVKTRPTDNPAALLAKMPPKQVNECGESHKFQRDFSEFISNINYNQITNILKYAAWISLLEKTNLITGEMFARWVRDANQEASISQHYPAAQLAELLPVTMMVRILKHEHVQPLLKKELPQASADKASFDDFWLNVARIEKRPCWIQLVRDGVIPNLTFDDILTSHIEEKYSLCADDEYVQQKLIDYLKEAYKSSDNMKRFSILSHLVNTERHIICAHLHHNDVRESLELAFTAVLANMPEDRTLSFTHELKNPSDYFAAVQLITHIPREFDNERTEALDQLHTQAQGAIKNCSKTGKIALQHYIELHDCNLMTNALTLTVDQKTWCIFLKHNLNQTIPIGSICAMDTEGKITFDQDRCVRLTKTALRAHYAQHANRMTRAINQVFGRHHDVSLSVIWHRIEHDTHRNGLLWPKRKGAALGLAEKMKTNENATLIAQLRQVVEKTSAAEKMKKAQSYLPDCTATPSS